MVSPIHPSKGRMSAGIASKSTTAVANRFEKEKNKRTQNISKKNESTMKVASSSTSRSRFANLKIDTSSSASDSLTIVNNGSKEGSTPGTATTVSDNYSCYDDEGSTPNHSNSGKLRGSGDIRSPGEKATPMNAFVTQNNNLSIAQSKRSLSKHNDHLVSPTLNTDCSAAPIPDFITQTDKFGNASTPRNPIQGQRTVVMNLESKENKDNGYGGDIPFDSSNDLCDTLLDSFRMMCCCLLSEDKAQKMNNSNPNVKMTKAFHRSRFSKKHHRHRLNKSHGQSSLNPPSRRDRKFPMLQHMDLNDADRVKLLPKIHPDDKGKKCLVLDLDETLVHSSFRAVPGADFVIPVQIEDVVHFVYVVKRPGVDAFLTEMAKYYEIIVYTASLNKYADPLLDLLDPHRVIRTRLFRESCVYFEGNYVKDLSLIDRDLSQSIIVDNSPNSYLFHPDNAIDCSSFIDDPMDRELIQIGGFLKNIRDASDVRGICCRWKEWPGK